MVFLINVKLFNQTLRRNHVFFYFVPIDAEEKITFFFTFFSAVVRLLGIPAFRLRSMGENLALGAA